MGQLIHILKIFCNIFVLNLGRHEVIVEPNEDGFLTGGDLGEQRRPASALRSRESLWFRKQFHPQYVRSLLQILFQGWACVVPET